MCIWNNKVALIINFKGDGGIEVLKGLTQLQMVVIVLVSTDDFEEITKLLQETYPSDFDERIKLYKCDLTNVKDVQAIYTVVKDIHGGVDVLIYNVHYNTDCYLLTGELKRFKKIIDININAVIACTRLSTECMIERKTRGHIIFLDLFKKEDSLNTVYFTSTGAVRSVNEILRHELRYLNANVKVTYVAFEEIQQSSLKLKDMAEVIKMILDTPEHLHIHEIFLDSSFV